MYAVETPIRTLHLVAKQDLTCIQKVTHLLHFDPEDEGSMHLRNFNNIAHIHTARRPTNGINTNN